ncbi:MAG TPA: FAD-binding oxidoreductase, partial [Candidatus Thermoplasmatota archaeon]|nr:FAD-binding oxidoreductase [Candidatus Thermoplasmatota archaeon]
PLKDRYQVVVIGGGANGLGVAWRLAEAGLTDVLVLERGYLLAGASGRNGGGVRAQWGTRDNLVLARDSIPLFRSMSAELGFNVWFRQGGYLFLAHSEEKARALRETVAFHRAHGVKSRVVDPSEAHVIAPEVNLDGVVAASFHPGDGIIFPWAVVFGLAKKCVELGVDVRTFTAAEGFDLSGGRVQAVRTSRGTVACDAVVNAAGCWSTEVASWAGVKLPNLPVRHEILVTEALKPFLDPMVVDLRNGLYVNQDMRGEVVSGIGMPGEKPGVNFASSFDFTRRVARALVDLVPTLGDVKVLRQWAGAYDVTPDGKPVLGPSPGVENLVQLNGASGHGFMISPMTTRLVADHLLGRRPEMDLTPYLASRFSDPGFTVEKETLVIG